MPYLRGTRQNNLPTKTWNPTFWLRDDFSIDVAAPLGTRVCEPGPGSMTYTDTNSKASVVGGKASFATGGASATGNPGAWGSQQTRLTGRAVVAALTQSAQNFELGWDSDQAGSLYDCLRLNTSGSAIRDAGTAIDIGLILTGGPFYFALIQRTTGFWAFVKGSGLPSWKLAWIGVTSSGNLYPSMGIASTTFVGNVDTLRGVDLPAPFDSDYGFVTQRLSGARAANDVIAHDANFFAEWTQTALPASGNTDIRFRVVDANNYLQALVSSTGALTLNAVVAGTPSQIATSAAAVAAGNRVSITMDGSTIRSYVGVTPKATGTSANFASQSDGVVSALGTSAAISDLITWPLYPNSLMMQMLNQAVLS